MNEPQKYKVLCFSFAGGTSFSYDVFKKFLPDSVLLKTFDYPGRGRRMQDTLLTHIDDLVNDVYTQIKDHIDQPYMIYAHSLGGLLAYKLAHHLKQKNERTPDSIFITGCRAPTAWKREKTLHDLPYDELIEEIRIMGGMPSQILNDNDFMKFYEPILRADFALVASYKHTVLPKLSIPFKVFTADEEDITVEDAKKWKEETSYDLVYNCLKGDHFFIFDSPEIIAREIVSSIKQWGSDKLKEQI